MSRVLFQHMQKTGGTSIVAMLENFFPVEDRCELGRLEGSDARKYLRASQAAFVHDNSNVLHLRTPGAFAFTFVREPFSRLRSARRQWTEASDQDIALMEAETVTAVMAMRAMPFHDILEHAFDYPITVPLFWNHQALSLGLPTLVDAIFGRPVLNGLDKFFRQPSDYRQWLNRNSCNILTSALRTLRSLDYIGLYEDFQPSVQEVFAQIGLPEPDILPHLNARPALHDERLAAARAAAGPFIDLDHEVYVEAKELNARHHRGARGAPVDYIGRAVSPTQDITLKADQALGGHGWHTATLRDDGRLGRWTGPGQRSYFSMKMEAGAYRIEVSIFGGVSEQALLQVALSQNGHILDVTIQMRADESWIVTATVTLDEARTVQFCLHAGETKDNLGLELEQIKVVGALAPTFLDNGTLSLSELPIASLDVEWKLGRHVGPADDRTFSMQEIPGGEGWHEAGFREDGVFSRWTGPGARSVFSIAFAPGCYWIVLVLCGAVSERALRGMNISVDGTSLDVEVDQGDRERLIAMADVRCEREGVSDIVIEVPEVTNGFGLEVESLRVAWIAVEDNGPIP